MEFLRLTADVSVDLTYPLPEAAIFAPDTVFTNCGTDIPGSAFAIRYDMLIQNVQALCDNMDTVTLSPGRYSLLRSGKAISDFLEAVDRDNLVVLPAIGALIANTSEEELFYALDGKLSGLLLTDIDLRTGETVPFSDGDVSWTTVLSLYHDHCEGLPLYLPDTDRFDDDCAFVLKLDDVAKRMLG